MQTKLETETQQLVDKLRGSVAETVTLDRADLLSLIEDLITADPIEIEELEEELRKLRKEYRELRSEARDLEKENEQLERQLRHLESKREVSHAQKS